MQHRICLILLFVCIVASPSHFTARYYSQSRTGLLQRRCTRGRLAATRKRQTRAYSSPLDSLPPMYRGDGLGGDGITIDADSAHTATLIFLHGLGDTAEGWLPGALELRPKSGHMKIILPTAPTRPVTLNGGMETTAWADVYGLEADSAEDVKGWESAFERAETLIKNEMNNGIPSNRIVLGGFSMGGAVALHTALRSKYQLGGVIALSTWLPLMDRFPDAIGERCPILMAHGTDDNIVKYSLGLRTNALLDSMNRDVSFVAVQGMGHTVSNGVVEECKKFIEGAVSRASASG